LFVENAGIANGEKRILQNAEKTIAKETSYGRLTAHTRAITSNTAIAVDSLEEY
jgi:hypothetical protein